jgi:hypothetical protein
MEFLMRFSDSWVPQVATANAAVNDACAAFPDYANEEERALETRGFLDGIVRSPFTLDAGEWVIVDRTGIHVTAGSEQKDWPLPDDSAGVTLPIRHAAVAVQHGTRIDYRHFLEFFTWVSYPQAGHIRRELHWRVVEISGSDAQIKSDQIMVDNQDTPYPSAEVSPELCDSVELRATNGGQVEWVMLNGLNGQRHGTIK